MQHSLSQQQRAIIPIAAFAASGDIDKLRHSLNQGLDKGLTINEIKAILVQTYAYAGFPRSLNALSTFMNVLEQRKVKGIIDVEGRTSQILSLDYQALKQGTENQTQLVGQPVKGPLFKFAPEIDEYLKTHLFGDIFSKNILSWTDREIATISMLAALNGVESQLKSHLQISLNIGITKQQLQEIHNVCEEQISQDAGERLAKLLSH
ncbi:carboxymuconolactone decarboxylase family protein [Acinetobacter courvalinii]|uniref:carboxymuconolactone decarboxylase family protein n=1 Tax=Acinetobacter courvalinii TaxID=280147 RepID=UPI003F5761A7